MNRNQQAHDALEALARHCFADLLAHDGAAFHRNPDETLDWDAKGAALVVLQDDESPEELAAMSGHTFDLAAHPELVIARRLVGQGSLRRVMQWDDVEALKAAIAQDRTLGGAVEYADVHEVENADLATKRWMGGGVAIKVRLMFNAPSRAG